MESELGEIGTKKWVRGFGFATPMGSKSTNQKSGYVVPSSGSWQEQLNFFKISSNILL